jgi:hypothetical protein
MKRTIVRHTMFAGLLGMSLMAGSAMAAVRFGVGVNFGVPAPVYAAPTPIAVSAQPPCPGPGYVWIDGFNGPTGFVAGYWALPPFGGAYWVAPRFDSGRFVAGFWGGTRIADTHANFHAAPLRDDRFRGADHAHDFHR